MIFNIFSKLIVNGSWPNDLLVSFGSILTFSHVNKKSENSKTTIKHTQVFNSYTRLSMLLKVTTPFPHSSQDYKKVTSCISLFKLILKFIFLQWAGDFPLKNNFFLMFIVSLKLQHTFKQLTRTVTVQTLVQQSCVKPLNSHHPSEQQGLWPVYQSP